MLPIMHFRRAFSSMAAALSATNSNIGGGSSSSSASFPGVHRGPSAVALLPASSPPPLSSPESFQAWLRHTAEWKAERDPAFSIALERRDIRRENHEELTAAAQRVKGAAAAYEPFRARIESLDRVVLGKQKEVESRTLAATRPTKKKPTAAADLADSADLAAAAAAAAAAAKRQRNEELLLRATRDLERLVAESAAAKDDCPPFHRHAAAVASLRSLEEDLGLVELGNSLRSAHRATGRATQRAGCSFEDTTRTIVEEVLLPELAARHGLPQGPRPTTTPAGDTEETTTLAVPMATTSTPPRLTPTPPLPPPPTASVAVLTNVAGAKNSIGLSSAELDVVVVEIEDDDAPEARNNGHDNSTARKGGAGARESSSSASATACRIRVSRVLAIVEAKSNANDVGRAFGHMQETVAFLAGDEGNYAPENWQTKNFPSGNFAEAAAAGKVAHQEKSTGVWYDFPPDAFRLFRRTTVPTPGADGDARGRELGAKGEPPNLYVENVYFVTRSGKLEGFHSQVSQELSSMLCNDVAFDIDDDDHITAKYEALQQRLAREYSTEDFVAVLKHTGTLHAGLFVIER
jgi:hypothetical protein